MDPDRTGTWGCELWDQWGAVVGQVETSTKGVTGLYGKFLSDRAKVGEREDIRESHHFCDQLEGSYARGLRNLVKKYAPTSTSLDEETSEQIQFR